MLKKRIIDHCTICQDLMQGIGWVESDAGTTSAAVLQHVYPVGGTRTDSNNVVILNHEGEQPVTFMRDFEVIINYDGGVKTSCWRRAFFPSNGK